MVKPFVLSGENRNVLEHAFLVNVVDKKYTKNEETGTYGYTCSNPSQTITKATFADGNGNSLYITGSPTEEGMFQIIIGLLSAFTMEYSLHIGGDGVEAMRKAIRVIVEEAMDRFAPETQVGMDIDFPITEKSTTEKESIFDDENLAEKLFGSGI